MSNSRSNKDTTPLVSASDDTKLRETMGLVKDTTEVMRHNMEKIIARDVALNELEDQSEELRDGANRFQVQSTRLKKKMCWQNSRMTLCVVFGVIVVIVVIALIIYGATKKT